MIGRTCLMDVMVSMFVPIFLLLSRLSPVGFYDGEQRDGSIDGH